MAASVQELLLAAQAKQKRGPLSQLADLVTAGSQGYGKGLEQGAELRKVKSEEELRRTQIMQSLIEIQALQEGMEEQRKLREEYQNEVLLNSEKTLREGQASVAAPKTPLTPVSKFAKEWKVDEKGKLSKSIKEITTPPPAPKAPSGFQFTTSGELEPIPGGPSDIKAQEEEARKRLNIQTKIDESKLVMGYIDSALSKVTNWSAGYGSIFQNVPASDAKALQAELKRIKSNLGIDQIKEMKAQSRTGATGFGALSDKELDVITSIVATLDQAQDPEQLRSMLNQIKASYAKWLELQKEGSTAPAGTVPAAGTPPPAGSAGSTSPPKATMRWNPTTKKLEPI